MLHYHIQISGTGNYKRLSAVNPSAVGLLLAVSVLPLLTAARPLVADAPPHQQKSCSKD